MTFIIDNIGKFFLILIACVAGWFTYNKWQEGEQWKHLGENFGASLQEVQPANAGKYQILKGNYWKLLAKLKDFQKDVAAQKITPIPPKGAEAPDDIKPDLATRWLVETALTSISEADPAKPIMIDTLIDNLAACDKFGIFTKDSNFEKMIEGKDPIISAGPFFGSALTITPRIAAEIAPSIARHHANFILVPSSITGIVSPDVDDKSFQFATKLKIAQILKVEEFEDLYKMYTMGRK